MTTTFSALDWRTMSQEERDLGLNNGVAVPGSVAMVAGWEQRSADLRKRYPDHLDLRYGPRERNRIDFLKAGEKAPTLLFIHGGYLQGRGDGRFLILALGPRAQPDRFSQGGRKGADAAVHSRRLLAGARQGSLYDLGRGPDGARHQRRADRLHAGAGRDAGSDRRRNPRRHRLFGKPIAGARRGRRRHRGIGLVRRRSSHLDGALASACEGGDGDIRHLRSRSDPAQLSQRQASARWADVAPQLADDASGRAAKTPRAGGR